MLHRTARQKTHSVHNELLLCLSPSSSLSDAFKWFGIDKKSKNIMVVLPDTPNLDKDLERLLALVQGDPRETLDFNSYLARDTLEKVPLMPSR
ncbi:hypothetical protein HDU91_004157 [Kappamyces sp. JEL0680]|nr:hypothetical protein HDU91_004157 [Kappamyces sp. JEL0680]